MKHGNGIKTREDKSSGIEILITEAFVKINPFEPLRLSKEQSRRNEIDPIPPVFYWSKPMIHGEHERTEDD